jgi:hypothetical protein
MKIISLSIRVLSVLLTLGIAGVSVAQNSTAKAKAPAGKLVPITEKEAAWAAKAKKEYPTAVCVISDDKLGDHGDVMDMIYRQDGKPDRLISFCCQDCVDDFNQNPQTALKALDDLDAKKKNPQSEHKHEKH